MGGCDDGSRDLEEARLRRYDSYHPPSEQDRDYGRDRERNWTVSDPRMPRDRSRAAEFFDTNRPRFPNKSWFSGEYERPKLSGRPSATQSYATEELRNGSTTAGQTTTNENGRPDRGVTAEAPSPTMDNLGSRQPVQSPAKTVEQRDGSTMDIDSDKADTTSPRPGAVLSNDSKGQRRGLPNNIITGKERLELEAQNRPRRAPEAPMSGRSIAPPSYTLLSSPASGSGTPNSVPMDPIMTSPRAVLRPDAQTQAGQKVSFAMPHVPNGNGALAKRPQVELKEVVSRTLRSLVKNLVGTAKFSLLAEEAKATIEKKSAEREKWREFNGPAYEGIAESDTRHLKRLGEARDKHCQKITDHEEQQDCLIEDLLKTFMTLPDQDYAREDSKRDQMKDELKELRAEVKTLRADSNGDNHRLIALEDWQKRTRRDFDQFKSDLGQIRSCQSSINKLEEQMKDPRFLKLDSLVPTGPKLGLPVTSGIDSPLVTELNMVKEQVRSLQQFRESHIEELGTLKQSVGELKTDVASRFPSMDNVLERLGETEKSVRGVQASWSSHEKDCADHQASMDNVLQRLDEAEKSAQDVQASWSSHQEDHVDHQARLVELESKEQSRQQQSFISSADFKTAQTHLEAIKTDQTKQSKLHSDLLSQFQTYALDHTTQLGRLQDSVQSTHSQIQKDIDGLREDMKKLQQDRQKTPTGLSANVSTPADQSSVAAQRSSDQGWQTGHSEQLAADRFSEILFLRQKVQALETFVHSHEQRLNNTTLEPFVRSIVNQMKTMYPYPDAVVRDLSALRGQYNPPTQLNQAIAQELPGIRTRLSQLEAKVNDNVGQTVTAPDERMTHHISEIQAGLKKLEDDVLEQKGVDHTSKEDKDRLESLERQFGDLDNESKAKLDDLAREIAKEVSVREQYHKKINDVLEAAKKKYDDQIGKIENGWKELQENLVKEVGEYHGKVDAIQHTLEKMRTQVNDLMASPPQPNRGNGNSAESAGQGMNGQTATRSSHSPTRSHTSSRGKSSRSDQQADAAPNLGHSVLGRKKKRRRVVSFSDDEDDPNYRP